ncbi:MAG: HAD hydrolase family protein [Verrucomicrobiota bacterium]
MDDLDLRAAKIRLLCTDIDGVLTTGALNYGREPGHTKAFNVRDGAATKWLQRAGIPVAFISGLDAAATRHRAQDLGVVDCFAGHLDKLPVLDQLCAKYGLAYDQVAHLGDDLPDLPLLSRVGLACCPSDAAPEVKGACHWVAEIPGGLGLLRLVAERILKAQGRWADTVGKYGA